MLFPTSLPKRYQLSKDGLRILQSGHPWIFRSHLSSAAEAFLPGQWLALYDGGNQVVGFGIYEAEGVVGIRVLCRGSVPPRAEYFRALILTALQKRDNVRKYTTAFRALHGENDGVPGVVVDIYGDTAVLQTYVPSVDALGRWAAAVVCNELGLSNLVWKMPAKRKKKRGLSFRILKGGWPKIRSFREGKMELFVDIADGQKSGTFLDLRGLRKWVAMQPLNGKRVLNLFCYSGMLARAAESAGAALTVNVDISQGALDFAKKYHVAKPAKHRFIQADIFEWVKDLPANEKYDLIICDPPLLASQTNQVAVALRAYRQLHQALHSHVNPGGYLVTACCTSRITREQFEEEAGRLGPKGFRKVTSLAAESDHPVGFSEGDYLKVLVFRANA